MRRWRLFLCIALLAVAVGVGTGIHARWRGAGLLRSAEEACRRFDFPAAGADLSAYVELHPSDAPAHLLAARCARRAEFLEHFNGPRPELLTRAARHLAAAQRLGATPQAVVLERALSRVQHGDPTDEDRTLVDQVKGGPEAPLALEALTHGLQRCWQFEKALACAELLMRRDPDNALALLWRGRIREQFHQRKGAREDFESGVSINPDFDAARYYLAESLLRSQQAGAAEPHLRRLTRSAPENLLVRLAWAKCRICQGDDAQGRELLDAWLADAPAHHPRLHEALTARAGLALAAGECVRAEGFAHLALHEAPLDQYAMYDLARSLHGQGRGPEARAVEQRLASIKRDLRKVAQCREQLAHTPEHVRLRHEIGTAYLRLGRPGEAVVWLTSVLERDPKYRPTLEALADYRARRGNELTAADTPRRLAAD
jgi:tetratricopeptide (TPR) repeat protein